LDHRVAEGSRSVCSQSQHSSSSRDHGDEMVDVTRWLVVFVLCSAASTLVLLPITSFGGARSLRVSLSVPLMSVLSASGPDDYCRSAADLQRQHAEFDLRQLLGLRQLHGINQSTNQSINQEVLTL